MRFLPFKLSALPCLLHWGREGWTEEENCHPTTQECLGQSQVTPVSPTCSPTIRRKEKFISNSHGFQGKLPIPQRAEAKWTPGRRNGKNAMGQEGKLNKTLDPSQRKGLPIYPTGELPVLMAARERGKGKSTRHKSVLSILVSNLFDNQEWPLQTAKWSLAFHVVSMSLFLTRWRYSKISQNPKYKQP